jgi:peptidoglycan/xylan/chitin deacetylase (PgdA/CDA1 family)
MSCTERRDVLERLAAWSGLELTPRADRRVLLGTEIQALSRIPGCAIGSHSARHLLLPGQPAEVQRAEVLECKRLLEGLVGQPVSSFCYPFGEHDDSVVSAVREAGHLLAVTVERGVVTRLSDPMLLPRMEVRDWPAEDLARMIDREFEEPAPGRTGI